MIFQQKESFSTVKLLKDMALFKAGSGRKIYNILQDIVYSIKTVYNLPVYGRRVLIIKEDSFPNLIDLTSFSFPFGLKYNIKID